MLLLLAVAFAGLCVRLLHIQYALAPRLRAIAAAQQETQREIPSRRGMIFDTRGRLLAGSAPCYSVYADPVLIERPDETASALAPVLAIDAGRIEDQIRTSGTPRFCWLARRIDDTMADAVRELELPGVALVGEFRRFWPMSETAAHVLGVVGADGQGLEGLELYYDDYLRGLPGQCSTLRDVRRRAIGRGSLPTVEPIDGGHLVLTLDSVIQQLTETRLRQQVYDHGAESGVALVMSPQTGDILALACEPPYDPNRYADFPASHRRNRVITDPVECGSTFKPFIVAGAFQRGRISVSEKINCHDGLHYFGGRRMRDTKPHGMLSVHDVLVYSSNIGMGMIGTRLGNEVLRSIITDFGFGAETQVGLPGESPGIVLPLSEWNSYSTTSVTMGQEIAVTPLQLATAFGALANGGFLVRPRVLRAKLAADMAVVERREVPEVIRQVVPEEIARYLTEEVLADVVLRGGRELDVGEYSMCGKTGTAQIPRFGRRGYEPGAYLSSFVAAAPARHPRIVVLVMIRKPDPARGHYGRVVAGPAVRDIVRSTLQYLQVPPSEESLVAAF